MRTLAIDYGEKRLGIAISDSLGITAQPLAVIERGASFDGDVGYLSKIIEKYPDLGEIVVGLPKTMKGEIGIQAKKVQEFVEALREVLKLSIVTFDERLTTAEAEKSLISAGLSRKKRKKVIDKSAAALILRNYLDTKR
ncbi:MAG: Holliday junction resolvase RuvX [Candidatus Saganbacteria bacterium]|nr:Holliday junction resolvase RuvX [Candidatus Saganbacteria bacterium]